MNHILVYCGNRMAIERYDTLPDWQVIVGIYPDEQRQEIVERWRDTPGGKLACDHSMLYGWRAPAGTLVLFDASWPFARDSAETIQAVARVAQPMIWNQ